MCNKVVLSLKEQDSSTRTIVEAVAVEEAVVEGARVCPLSLLFFS